MSAFRSHTSENYLTALSIKRWSRRSHSSMSRCLALDQIDLRGEQVPNLAVTLWLRADGRRFREKNFV